MSAKVKHFRLCVQHAHEAEQDPETRALPNSIIGPNPIAGLEPLVCREEGCKNPVYKTFGVRCYHNRIPVFFHVETKTIKKACWVCRQRFDVPLEEAKSLYIEHTGCGGLLARWLDPDTFRLKAGCTKCDYTEDKAV